MLSTMLPLLSTLFTMLPLWPMLDMPDMVLLMPDMVLQMQDMLLLMQDMALRNKEDLNMAHPQLATTPLTPVTQPLSPDTLEADEL